MGVARPSPHTRWIHLSKRTSTEVQSRIDLTWQTRPTRPELLFSLTLTVDNRNCACRCLLGRRVLSPFFDDTIGVFNH